MIKKKLLFLLVFLTTAVIPATADTIEFTANTMKGNTGSQQESTVLSGAAWISTDSLEITADTIELSGSNYRKISATGKVTGTNKKSHFTFTCDSLEFDRETEIAKLSGNVLLLDDENKVTATAGFMEYNQQTEIALMQINVHLTRGNSDCTSTLAVYRKNDQILEMSGSPKIVRGEDTFTAQEIMFNLDTEEITMDGRVRGTVTDSADE